MKRTIAYLIIVCSMLVASCSKPQRTWRIGVSQCSHDIWREKQNAELRMGAYFHENVELCFAAAYDSDERQVEQIDSLVASGIDLLIVAPNQVQTISPAIDRAYDSGIPVIVFERKTNSQKYTAFMSADNYEMGRVMGQFIVNRLNGHGRVLEVMGLNGSSPAIERHNGFMDAVLKSKGIQVAASLQGDWTEPTAQKVVKQWLQQHPDEKIDLVFGMNDRSAMGARRAFSDVGRRLPLFCGIDGLPGKDGGIRLVRDSILEASFIYPTYGDRVLQLAADILDGKSYKKETRLMSALVTRDNARVLLMQTDEIMHQASNLDRLHRKADGLLRQLDTQRALTLLACIIIVLLLVALVLLYLYETGKMKLRQERVVNSLWSLNSEEVLKGIEEKTEAQDADSEEAKEEQVTRQEEKPDEGSEKITDSLFITRFKEVVESRLQDSELSVEDLAADMNLSRVQLYRKVKSITDSSPVELLRSARLKRGYQLLLTTDKSISEVAYSVGFTAPSYFTKCFKEEYGKLPGEIRS